MKTPLPVVEDMLVEHKLNTIAVFDTAEKLRLYFKEGEPDVLAESLRSLSTKLEGAFLVKAWRRTPRQSGRRPEAQATYTWILQGKKDDAPVQGLSGGIPESIVNELAQLRAEKQLRELLTAEEPEEKKEEEEEGADAMGHLVDMLGDLLKPKAPQPSPTASAHKGHPAAMTKERMARILHAIRRCHEEDPSTFETYESALLSTYGQAKAS